MAGPTRVTEAAGAAPGAGALDLLVRRDRVVVVAGLAVVIAMAWVWLLAGAGSGMSPIEMTAMAGMDGWLMRPAQWTPGYAGLMVVMWWVMMTAMMLPSAAPTLLLYARVARGRAAAAPSLPAAAMAAGYLLAWGGFSLAATGLQWGLERGRALSPMLIVTNRWLGIAILVAAGAWQLTALKAMCLRHCRSPLGYLMSRWRPGLAGALRMGLGHGAYCLGCCWVLMGLLFFGGVMNLYWIIGLTGLVILEKAVRRGPWLERVTGAALLAWAGALAVS
jgi:predicted metal-binding membrane protein